MSKFSNYEFNGVTRPYPLSEHIAKEVLQAYDGEAYKFTDRIFGESDRITLPVNSKEKSPEQILSEFRSDPRIADFRLVDGFIKGIGYEIVDYGKGLVKGPDDRVMKVGRLLERHNANDDIKRLFVNGPSRAASKQNQKKMVITISRNPFDIAAMSTGRGWVSCMQAGGWNFRYVFEDLKKGTHIAYYHEETDRDIKNPTCRILLKPYKIPRSRKLEKKILQREVRPYGTHVPGFLSAVDTWLEDNFKKLDDKCYDRLPGLYADGGPVRVVNITDKTTLVDSDKVDDRLLAAQHGTDSIRLRLVGDDDGHVATTAAHSIKDPEILAKVDEVKLSSRHDDYIRSILASKLNPRHDSHVPLIIKYLSKHGSISMHLRRFVDDPKIFNHAKHKFDMGIMQFLQNDDHIAEYLAIHATTDDRLASFMVRPNSRYPEKTSAMLKEKALEWMKSDNITLRIVAKIYIRSIGNMEVISSLDLDMVESKWETIVNYWVRNSNREAKISNAKILQVLAHIGCNMENVARYQNAFIPAVFNQVMLYSMKYLRMDENNIINSITESIKVNPVLAL